MENEKKKSGGSQSQYFPIGSFLYFDTLNIAGLKKKVLEFNEKLV
jgi:hypothetical protein